MLIELIQLLLAAIACGLLFAAFRWFLRDRTIALIVGIGFLVRAVAGQLLFWISFLYLPIGRDLQAGNGLWFYARDGRGYFEQAWLAVEEGFGAIVHIDPNLISPGFSQVLALFGFLFGAVVSTSLLLNLAAYLGTCAVAVKLAGDDKRAAALSVAALSFSPSAILWSTQPLKDVLFLFLLAAFIGAAASWIAVWRREERAFPRAIAVTLLLLLVFCAIAGIRWYFAFALLLISAPILFVAALRTRVPWRASALLVAMYGVVFAAAVWVAGQYLPYQFRALVTEPTVGGAMRTPYALAGALDGARQAFDQMEGSTKITPRAAPFLGGTAALLLPRPIARATGLVDVGGGRGLFFFADLDTVVFDLVLIVAVLTLMRAKWRSPLVWLVVIFTLAVGAAFVYTISNFGALFRYRSMVFLGIAMIPAVAAWSARDDAPRLTNG
ncbi:MAG TPA: hypothetical protein VKB93_09670 [Thermoanaerobaculia bacterium]|nr:hypothetical protein [Thermoanaerobaculia bacterium]